MHGNDWLEVEDELVLLRGALAETLVHLDWKVQEIHDWILHVVQQVLVSGLVAGTRFGGRDAGN
jgi:hypothetical protein